MQVTLTPHAEELMEAALARGVGSSPEEIVERALETIAEQAAPTAERKRTPAEAVAHIRESRKGVTLGGLKIKDLSTNATSTDGLRHRRLRHAALAICRRGHVLD